MTYFKENAKQYLLHLCKLPRNKISLGLNRKQSITIKNTSLMTRPHQGLNKKEIQPYLCNMFSIFIFNQLYLFA